MEVEVGAGPEVETMSVGVFATKGEETVRGGVGTSLCVPVCFIRLCSAKVGAGSLLLTKLPWGR